MARSLDNVAIETFRDRVIFLSQQGDTLLRRWTTEEHKESAAHNWERLGESAMSAKTRGVSTDSHDFDAETAWTRRVSVPTPKAVTDYTQREDLREVIIDPNGSYAISHGMAARRAYDDTIIAALGAAALDGDGNTNALPAGQIIGDYTDEISFDMITEGISVFFENDVDPDFAKVGVIGPKQVRKLLNMEQATNADYTALMALQNKGYVDDWMGISWVNSNRGGLVPGVDQRDVWLMTNQAVGLQIKSDIYCEIEQLPTHSYEWQVFTGLDIGAVRIEDTHAVNLRVADTYTP
jgi:hypothetical protein